MIQDLLRFLLLFVMILVGSYFIHTATLNYFSLNSNTSIINISYVFNGVFAVILILGVILIRTKFKDQIGFIFLAGSFIKLVVFVGMTKLMDIEINKTIFLDFFIPYAICLILEVYYISKILKQIK